jgi:hypothetical protein
VGKRTIVAAYVFRFDFRIELAVLFHLSDWTETLEYIAHQCLAEEESKPHLRNHEEHESDANIVVVDCSLEGDLAVASTEGYDADSKRASRAYGHPHDNRSKIIGYAAFNIVF